MKQILLFSIFVVMVTNVAMAQKYEIPSLFRNLEEATEYANRVFPKGEVRLLEVGDSSFLALIQEQSGMLLSNVSIYERGKALTGKGDMEIWKLVVARPNIADSVEIKVSDDGLVLEGKVKKKTYLVLPVSERRSKIDNP